MVRPQSRTFSMNTLQAFYLLLLKNSVQVHTKSVDKETRYQIYHSGTHSFAQFSTLIVKYIIFEELLWEEAPQQADMAILCDSKLIDNCVHSVNKRLP